MRDAIVFRYLTGFFLAFFTLFSVQGIEAVGYGYSNTQTFNTSSTDEMNRGNVGSAYSGTAAYPYPNQYNTNRPGTILPGYNESYYMDDEDNQSLTDAKMARESDHLNRMAPPILPADRRDLYGAVAVPAATPSESQFLVGLTPEERSIYFGLDAESKGLALQLATQGGYQNRGIAVKEAQRRMNERRDAYFAR